MTAANYSANDLLKGIYELIDLDDQTQVEDLLPQWINYWEKINEWDELSTLFYAGEPRRLGKKNAKFMLKCAHSCRRRIWTYESFIDRCNSELGNDGFDEYRKDVLPGSFGAW